MSTSSVPTVVLPYGDSRLRLVLAAGRFTTLAPPAPPALADPQTTLRAALATPIDAAPLAACVRARDRVTIVVSDGTRATGVRALMPTLLGELDRAGVPAARAEIYLHSTLPPDVVARSGLRPLTRVEDFFAAVAQRHGRDVEGYVLPEGARYLPVVEAAA